MRYTPRPARPPETRLTTETAPPPTALRPAAGETVWTVKAVLESSAAFLKGKGSESPRLEAEILLAHVLGCDRIQLYVKFSQPLTDDQRAAMRDLIRRRAAAEPVAYLVGHREFFSKRFAVNPDVLIPRPSTETLVMEALEAGKAFGKPHVLELCTGCGCVAVCVACGLRDAEVLATDISDDALVVARGNARTHGVEDRVSFAGGDLFAAVPAGDRFDLILANPPYVRDDEFDRLPPDVQAHEPSLALLSGAEGTEHALRIVAEAPARLNPGGWLMIENASPQTPGIEDRFRDAGFVDIRTATDGDGLPRIVVGRRP